MPSLLSSTLTRVAWCQIAFKIIAHFDGVVGCLHCIGDQKKSPTQYVHCALFLEVCLLSLASLLERFQLSTEWLNICILRLVKNPLLNICTILQEQLVICFNRSKNPLLNMCTFLQAYLLSLKNASSWR